MKPGVAAFHAAASIPYYATAATIVTATREQLADDHTLRMAVICSPRVSDLRDLVVARRDQLDAEQRSADRAADIERARTGAA